MTNFQEVLVTKKALTQQLDISEGSSLKKYREKVYGDGGFSSFLEYEIVTLFLGSLPGGLGYLLRKLLYRRLFMEVGKGVIIGKGVVLRHPGRISIGNRVAVDDHVLFDASGAGEKGVIIANDVIISRNCVIQAKTGPVVIRERADIGPNTTISSVTGVSIGQSALIAANCYIGGARYMSKRIDLCMMDQGTYSKGPVVIENDVWLGAGVIVLDGVRIGKGCIVGAGAVVTKNLPDHAIAVGVPAAVQGYRG